MSLVCVCMCVWPNKSPGPDSFTAGKWRVNLWCLFRGLSRFGCPQAGHTHTHTHTHFCFIDFSSSTASRQVETTLTTSLFLMLGVQTEKVPVLYRERFHRKETILTKEMSVKPYWSILGRSFVRFYFHLSPPSPQSLSWFPPGNKNPSFLRM